MSEQGEGGAEASATAVERLRDVRAAAVGMLAVIGRVQIGDDITDSVTRMMRMKKAVEEWLSPPVKNPVGRPRKLDAAAGEPEVVDGEEFLEEPALSPSERRRLRDEKWAAERAKAESGGE